jgi:hypothetical protein
VVKANLEDYLNGMVPCFTATLPNGINGFYHLFKKQLRCSME